jgi:hypothetical protein
VSEALRFGCAARGRGGKSALAAADGGMWGVGCSSNIRPTARVPCRAHQAPISAKHFAATAGIGLAAAGFSGGRRKGSRRGPGAANMNWPSAGERPELPARVAETQRRDGTTTVMQRDRQRSPRNTVGGSEAWTWSQTGPSAIYMSCTSISRSRGRRDSRQRTGAREIPAEMLEVIKPRMRAWGAQTRRG